MFKKIKIFFKRKRNVNKKEENKMMQETLYQSTSTKSIVDALEAGDSATSSNLMKVGGNITDIIQVLGIVNAIGIIVVIVCITLGIIYMIKGKSKYKILFGVLLIVIPIILLIIANFLSFILVM
jgi:uncharacterized membrane protein (UPF0182 family)